MTRSSSACFRWLLLLPVILVTACGTTPKHKPRDRERQCMARAMYFESNRSSADGMLAVGTVVMNRVQSGQYPASVCGVVGQKSQFAPGVLSKEMKEGRSRALAEQVADAVLRGKRHRGVGDRAMFFHTAGHRFSYRNMHYVYVAGGNAFYEKRKGTTNDPRRQDKFLAEAARREPEAHRTALAMVGGRPARARAARPVMMAEKRTVAPNARPDAFIPVPAPVQAYVPAPPSEPSIEALIMADGY